LILYGVTGVLIITTLFDCALSFGAALTLICCVSGFASALMLTEILEVAPAARVPKRQTLIAARLQIPGVLLSTKPLETISVNDTLPALFGPLFLTVNL
jgi:hypothetical protein